MKKLELIKTVDGIDYLRYRPNCFHLYADCYRGEDVPYYFHRPIHWVRMERELVRAHYEVVYIRCGGSIIGHFVVSRGGTRVAISNNRDIVIGPIWIIPSRRGESFATKGIAAILSELGFSFENAFEFIEDDNLPSIRTVEKNGFELLFRCSERGLMKTLVEDENGSWLLYRFKNRKT